MTVEISRNAERVFAAAMVGGFEELGVYLVGRVRLLINRGNRLGLNPSLPGEPPKKVTARLFKSITSGVFVDDEGLLLRVGTNVHYARPLELGWQGEVRVRAHTRRGRPVRAHEKRVTLAARPFLRRAVIENRHVLGRIVAARLIRLAGGG